MSMLYINLLGSIVSIFNYLFRQKFVYKFLYSIDAKIYNSKLLGSIVSIFNNASSFANLYYRCVNSKKWKFFAGTVYIDHEYLVYD